MTVEMIVKLASRTAIASSPERRVVDVCAAAAGVTLTPLHPSSTDPELASYLVGYVEPAALEGVLERLRRCDGVEGAYAKPRGEPPERM